MPRIRTVLVAFAATFLSWGIAAGLAWSWLARDRPQPGVPPRPLREVLRARASDGRALLGGVLFLPIVWSGFVAALPVTVALDWAPQYALPYWWWAWPDAFLWPIVVGGCATMLLAALYAVWNGGGGVEVWRRAFVAHVLVACAAGAPACALGILAPVVPSATQSPLVVLLTFGLAALGPGLGAVAGIARLPAGAAAREEDIATRESSRVAAPHLVAAAATACAWALALGHLAMVGRSYVLDEEEASRVWRDVPLRQDVHASAWAPSVRVAGAPGTDEMPRPCWPGFPRVVLGAPSGFVAICGLLPSALPLGPNAALQAFRGEDDGRLTLVAQDSIAEYRHAIAACGVEVAALDDKAVLLFDEALRRTVVPAPRGAHFAALTAGPCGAGFFAAWQPGDGPAGARDLHIARLEVGRGEVAARRVAVPTRAHHLHSLTTTSFGFVALVKRVDARTPTVRLFDSWRTPDYAYLAFDRALRPWRPAAVPRLLRQFPRRLLLLAVAALLSLLLAAEVWRAGALGRTLRRARARGTLTPGQAHAADDHGDFVLTTPAGDSIRIVAAAARRVGPAPPLPGPVVALGDVRPPSGGAYRRTSAEIRSGRPFAVVGGTLDEVLARAARERDRALSWALLIFVAASAVPLGLVLLF